MWGKLTIKISNKNYYGLVWLIGETEVAAEKWAGMVKRIVTVIEIDYAYSFLKSNLRQSEKVLEITHKRMLTVEL